jgi:acyl transferase domain-containing protein/surfactin synthase thioesterase subunit/acyl carrier protein
MTLRRNSAGVAIVGIACRFPGASNHRDYWSNLCNSIESITALSDEQLAAAGVPAELLQDPCYVKAASALSDIDLFDAGFFEYSPKEACLMDPQQRFLLEVAWEAYEDAGRRPGGPVGVFVGSGGVVSSYLVDRLALSSELPGYTGSLAHIANDKDFPSTRVSYKLNLTGPSINIQTACSTSMVAVHLACQAILAGECDMALAGAATIRVPEHVGYVSVPGGILSPDGHCRAFDAQAQGTIFGSGVGLVLLKDYSAAVADGDNIYAVIRGSAINNDGADKVSYTASSVAGQAKAMVEAMAIAEVSADDIGYVECHGTGTIIGDPLEIDALKAAFRTQTDRRAFCAIGSVKTNIGHLEQTAGVAALIKTALALKYGTLPPSLNFKKPNPKIDFADSPFFVNTACREWPGGDKPRLAAVNSLGLGGTNAFVVLEEAIEPEEIKPAAVDRANEPSLHLFTLSARSDKALRTSIERHLVHLDANPGIPIADVCFTSTSGRAHFAQRFAAVGVSTAQLRSALAEELRSVPADASAKDVSGKRKLAFLFSGQASQYAGMGAELYWHPLFRSAVDRCAEFLRDRLAHPFLPVLFGTDGATDLIDETAYTQPALFAVQVALVEVWRSWGIVPDVVLGHSVGEFAAAYCAGAYTLDGGLALIADRARLMQELPRHGAMASIYSDEAAVAMAIKRYGADDVAIAAVNGPQQLVISGRREAVQDIVSHFDGLGVRCQPLTVSHAFHSSLMQPAVERFKPVAAAVRALAPEITWISTVSGDAVDQPPDARYWCDHALRPVRFADGMRTLRDMGITDFVEIGPGSTLLTLGQHCLGPGDERAWLGSLGKRGENWRLLLSSLGRLYQRGYEIDWDGFNRPHKQRRVSLPTYPFERRRFWLDNDRSPQSPMRVAPADTSLTGVRIRSPLPEIQFESSYSLQRFSYLADHRIYGFPVLPMTAGLAAVRDAASQHFGTPNVTIANLQYHEAMVLPEICDRIVQIVLTPVDQTTAEFRLVSIATDAEAAWRSHMIGMARIDGSEPIHETSIQRDRIKLRCPVGVPIDQYYATIDAMGLEYGPAFRGIETMWRGNGEVLTRVCLPSHLAIDPALNLHPALLDSCLHAYPALLDAYGEAEQVPKALRRTHLPIGIERFRSNANGRAPREVWVHATRRHGQGDQETFTIDISIYQDDGTWVATIEGLSLKRLPPTALRPQLAAEPVDWLYQMRWDERAAVPVVVADEANQPAGWLILADRSGVGSALSEILSQRGDACHLIHLDDTINRAGGQTWRSAVDLLDPFAALIADLARSKPGLRGIVDLWALDVVTEGLTVDELEAVQKTIVGGALALFQAVAQTREFDDAGPRIWFVSRNAVSVSPDDPPTEAASAGVWGLGRTVALEHPRIWGGLFDLGAVGDALPSRDAAGLLRELLKGDGEDQVALRSDRRYVARLVRLPVPSAPQKPFDAEASYLITGGLGALAIETAKWMVTRRGAKHLILASRRGEQDSSAVLTRDMLAALGAEVTILKADVTNERDVRELLDRIAKSSRPLKGIFHCAGLLDDGILIQMNWQKFHRVMVPKVAGAWLLHELTQSLKLDHFVLFSSILSLIGSAGQANYAAANAFLDALVRHRRSQGLPALALNSGPWAESGLATASGDKGRAIWRARGTEYISTSVGWQAFDVLIGSDISHAAITITEWPAFFQQFTNVPRLYDELRKEEGPASRPGEASVHAAALKSQLSNAPKSERRGRLIAFVRQQAMNTLGLTEPIDVTRPLSQLGLDSLMSITLVNRLETSLGVRVSTAKLIQGPSIEALVDDTFAELIEGDNSVAEEPVGAAPQTDGGGWLVVVGPRASPRMRLFCFPFAGGGSAVYRNWVQSVDPSIELIAIEPPGRLTRINERPISDIDEFVDKLVSEMDNLLDRPFAFFGHCLGGLTMYETARRLIHSTRSRPCHLFASGARPPDRIADEDSFEARLTDDLMKLVEFRINLPLFAQPDDVFARMIRHFNIRATDQLLEDPELRQLMLPVIRAEFKMASDYEFVSEQPWEIPITCFAARGDPYVSRRHALGWGRFTNSRFQVHIREGAHFAVVDDATFIHSVINQELLAPNHA